MLLKTKFYPILYTRISVMLEPLSPDLKVSKRYLKAKVFRGYLVVKIYGDTHTQTNRHTYTSIITPPSPNPLLGNAQI